MSVRLKASVIILLLMACSTAYFLHLIDAYEKVLAGRLSFHAAQKADIFAHTVELSPYDNHSEGKYMIIASHYIYQLYRYLFYTNMILLISIFLIPKSIKRKPAG